MQKTGIGINTIRTEQTATVHRVYAPSGWIKKLVFWLALKSGIIRKETQVKRRIEDIPVGNSLSVEQVTEECHRLCCSTGKRPTLLILSMDSYESLSRDLHRYYWFDSFNFTERVNRMVGLTVIVTPRIDGYVIL